MEGESAARSTTREKGDGIARVGMAVRYTRRYECVAASSSAHSTPQSTRAVASGAVGNVCVCVRLCCGTGCGVRSLVRVVHAVHCRARDSTQHILVLLGVALGRFADKQALNSYPLPFSIGRDGGRPLGLAKSLYIPGYNNELYRPGMPTSSRSSVHASYTGGRASHT